MTTIKELRELAQKESTNPIIMGIVSFLEEKHPEKKVVAKKTK